MLNLSLPDTINNACDPMQNPGQTQIFYKVGQTWMTHKKSDPDDPTQLQRWYKYTLHLQWSVYHGTQVIPVIIY